MAERLVTLSEWAPPVGDSVDEQPLHETLFFDSLHGVLPAWVLDGFSLALFDSCTLELDSGLT